MSLTRRLLGRILKAGEALPDPRENAEKEFFLLIQLLLKKGANSNALYNEQPLLHQAVLNDWPLVIGELLAYGADKNLRNYSKLTALELAKKWRKLKAVCALEQVTLISAAKRVHIS